MAKPKDTLSNESLSDKKKAPTGLGWASKLMGKAANTMANREIFGDMKSRNIDPADVPVLLATGMPGGGMNTAQLQVINMPFVSPDSGNTHQVEGYHLPAQPGKPTMVFFGGTDMDRKADHYKDLIKTMAEQAKRQGTGLIVMDYPSNANEGKIKAQVEQMQQHMAQNMGIPLNQQAYAGYSLGGNPALYAARTNPDAAGLHLTSTVSSIRQESKNAMAASGSYTKIADKGQLSTLMDNIDETRQLIQTQQNRPGGPMPVSIAYSSQERFGRAGNNHMAPLLNEFNNYPVPVKVAVSNFAVGANQDAHQVILKTPENVTSMRDFMRDAEQSVRARQALAAPGVAPVVPAVGPAVAPVIAPPGPGPALAPVMPAVPPVPVPPPPPLPVVDYDADVESLTASTDDTTTLSEGAEEDVDLDALGFDFDDDDDLGPDALSAESPSLGSDGASSSVSSLEEGESEEEEVDLDALGFDFEEDDLGPDVQKVQNPSVPPTGGSGSSSAQEESESEEEEVDLAALGIEFEDDDDIAPSVKQKEQPAVDLDDGGLSFEPDDDVSGYGAGSPGGKEADDMEEEFDDFDLDVQLNQQNQQQRELRPHQAPEPGTQEMKPLGQKYVDGEKNLPSRTTEVAGQEVSVKEKDWLRQMTNEKRAGEGKTAQTPEEWAARKDVGTTMYMDEEQREEARVGFANQDNPAVKDGTSVAVTDQDGRELDGRNIFVMDQEGQMFAYNEQDSTKKLKEGAAPELEGNVAGKQVHVHHSSFLAGEEVAAAGEFVVGDNTILRDKPLSQEEANELGVDAKTAKVSTLKEVNNRSGHYLPGAQQAMQSLDQFARQGVEMDNTKFTLHRSGADGGPEVVEGMAKEFMQGRATPDELANAAGNEEQTAKLKGAAEKTFVARHQVMAELKQGQPELNRVDRPDLPDERSTDRPKIEFDDDDDEGVSLDFSDDDSGYAPKVDDEDKAQKQNQATKPASYSEDDEDFSPDVDDQDEELGVEENVSEEVDEKQVLEEPGKDLQQAQPAPAVSGPAEDSPAPKAPSVRDSLRASSQKQDGFQQGVKPNSVRGSVKVEIGSQRAPGPGPKVGG